MADDTRQSYYITAKDLPVAIAMDDVTFTEAMAVATHCSAGGHVLSGPDEGPEGFVVNFDLVPAFRVTPKTPPGPSMAMPASLIAELLQEVDDESELTPDDETSNGRE